MGRAVKRRGPLPDVLSRLFGETWQRWEFPAGVARPLEGDPPDEVRHILAVPARQVIATPLWIEGTDAALAPETVKLELEVRGLLPRPRGMDGTTLRLLPQRERTLALVAVFPQELPADYPAAEAFEASPHLVSLPRDAATLWREGEDFVVAFTRGDDVVYWETIDRTVGTTELRTWLGLLSVRLRGEAVLDAPPRIVSWIEGIPASRIAPEGSNASEDELSDVLPGAPSLRQARLTWKPESVVRAEVTRLQRARIKSIVLAVAACYIVIAAGLTLYFGALRWQISRLGGESAKLHSEIETFQPIARDWRTLAPTLTPSTYPLELLRGAVSGMPPKGVRLIVFRVEDGKLNISGEADTFQMATDYYNTLAAAEAFHGFKLESDTPQMKPNGSASFAINGMIPTP